MNIFDRNKLNIHKRISIGFEILNKNYKLKEIDTKEFKHLQIKNMDYSIKQYEIKDVGNLLIMVSKDSTDIFKSTLGIDKTKEFLNKVFLATELYKR